MQQFSPQQTNLEVAFLEKLPCKLQLDYSVGTCKLIRVWLDHKEAFELVEENLRHPKE